MIFKILRKEVDEIGKHNHRLKDLKFGRRKKYVGLYTFKEKNTPTNTPTKKHKTL